MISNIKGGGLILLPFIYRQEENSDIYSFLHICIHKHQVKKELTLFNPNTITKQNSTVFTPITPLCSCPDSTVHTHKL